MYCANCGTKRTADAHYCQKCGTAFGSTEAEPDHSTTPVFELCKLNAYIVKSTGDFERLLNPFAKDSWCWIAETVGTGGKATIAESSEFRERYVAGAVPRNQEARAARDEIVAKLVRDGWEPIDANYKDQGFRRRSPS
jgi:hypothetical protein